MKVEEFFTREVANEGLLMPLKLPNGEPSDEWIRVLGRDSDQFRAAELIANRKALNALESFTGDAHAAEEIGVNLQRECIAALISAWSFELELTLDNKLRVLREAPQIADAINLLAGDRARFFTNKVVDISSQSKPAQNSLKSKRTAKKA